MKIRLMHPDVYDVSRQPVEPGRKIRDIIYRKITTTTHDKICKRTDIPARIWANDVNLKINWMLETINRAISDV